MMDKWNAKWIAPAGVEDTPNCYFMIRKQFQLESKLDKALIKIAAESFYKLYINNRQVAIGPARGNKTRNFYDEIDVAEYLNEGENYIAATIHCINSDNFISAPYRPCALIEFENIIFTDSSWECRVAEEWKEESLTSLAPKLGYIECLDYQKEPVGWQIGEDSEEWQHAVEVSEAEHLGGKLLLPRDVPLLKEECHTPVALCSVVAIEDDMKNVNIAQRISLEKHSANLCDRVAQLSRLCNAEDEVILMPHEDQKDLAVIVDFGREVTGSFLLDITAEAGVIIDIGYDEILSNGRIRAAFCQGLHNFASRFTTKNGHQVIDPFRQEMGYRYLQLTFRNLKAPVIIHSLKARDRRYPFNKKAATFLSSDYELNKIWDTCKETISACTTDTFTDCPWRERTLWINDIIVTNMIALQVFGDARIAARCLRMANGDRAENGLIYAATPNTSMKKHLLFPTSVYFVQVLHDYWMYTGDSKLLNEILPEVAENYLAIEEWEDEYCHLKPEGYWNFFEWSYEACELSLNDKNTSLLNWMYAWCLNSLSEMLKAIGCAGKADYYAAKIPKIVEGMNAKFKDEGSNCYVDWLEKDGTRSNMVSQLSQALAVLSGCLPENEEAVLYDNIFNTELHQTELFMSHFQFLASEKAGNQGKALEKIKKLWGMIVKTGSPTIWENAVYKVGREFAGGAGSHCHAFSSGPISFFQRTILGVKPLEPGFEIFTIDPVPLDLEFAHGRVPTPAGDIKIEWSCNYIQERMDIKFTVPHGLTAQFNGHVYGSGTHEVLKAC